MITDDEHLQTFTCLGHLHSLLCHSWSGVSLGTHLHKVYLPSKNTLSVQSSDSKLLSDLRMAMAISSEGFVVYIRLKIPDFKHLAKPIRNRAITVLEAYGI